MQKLNIVGPAVRQIRLSYNPPVSQQDLAIKLEVLGWDIDRFGVSKIERGQRQVTDKELVLLAKALEITVGRLVGEE